MLLGASPKIWCVWICTRWANTVPVWKSVSWDLNSESQARRSRRRKKKDNLIDNASKELLYEAGNLSTFYPLIILRLEWTHLARNQLNCKQISHYVFKTIGLDEEATLVDELVWFYYMKPFVSLKYWNKLKNHPISQLCDSAAWLDGLRIRTKFEGQTYLTRSSSPFSFPFIKLIFSQQSIASA